MSPEAPHAPIVQASSPARRRLLERAVYALGGLFTAVVAAPLLGPIIAPLLRRRTPRSFTVGKVMQFPEGAMTPATFEVVTQDGWREVRETRKVYVHRAGDAFTVFSLTCTHLGCSVRWDDSTQRFRCPCHGGVYDADGQVESGPPPRPLPHYAATVRDSDVIVTEA